MSGVESLNNEMKNKVIIVKGINKKVEKRLEELGYRNGEKCKVPHPTLIIIFVPKVYFHSDLEGLKTLKSMIEGNESWELETIGNKEIDKLLNSLEKYGTLYDNSN